MPKAQFLAVLFIVWATSAFAQTQKEIPPAYGPHINLQPKDFAGSKSFKSSDRIVGTYYFYWVLRGEQGTHC